jgi:hypothetical protein
MLESTYAYTRFSQDEYGGTRKSNLRFSHTISSLWAASGGFFCAFTEKPARKWPVRLRAEDELWKESLQSEAPEPPNATSQAIMRR